VPRGNNSFKADGYAIAYSIVKSSNRGKWIMEIRKSVGVGWSSAGFSDRVSATVVQPSSPEVVLGAIVERLDSNLDGVSIVALQPAWVLIGKIIRDNPAELLSLTPEQWEELIAASYDKAGFDEVILTPRSGDFGRDVIATKNGWGSVRIIDQVKAYKPGHLVTANDVRALLGVLSADRAATKGVVTTTSSFAPRISEDPFISPYVPYRLELHDGEQVKSRLLSLTSG